MPSDAPRAARDRYELDFDARVARVVWQFFAPFGRHSGHAGSVYSLESGRPSRGRLSSSFARVPRFLSFSFSPPRASPPRGGVASAASPVPSSWCGSSPSRWAIVGVDRNGSPRADVLSSRVVPRRQPARHVPVRLARLRHGSQRARGRAVRRADLRGAPTAPRDRPPARPPRAVVVRVCGARRETEIAASWLCCRDASANQRRRHLSVRRVCWSTTTRAATRRDELAREDLACFTTTRPCLSRDRCSRSTSAATRSRTCTYHSSTRRPPTTRPAASAIGLGRRRTAGCAWRLLRSCQAAPDHDVPPHVSIRSLQTPYRAAPRTTLGGERYIHRSPSPAGERPAPTPRPTPWPTPWRSVAENPAPTVQPTAAALDRATDETTGDGRDGRGAGSEPSRSSDDSSLEILCVVTALAAAARPSSRHRRGLQSAERWEAAIARGSEGAIAVGGTAGRMVPKNGGEAPPSVGTALVPP